MILHFMFGMRFWPGWVQIAAGGTS